MGCQRKRSLLPCSRRTVRVVCPLWKKLRVKNIARSIATRYKPNESPSTSKGKEKQTQAQALVELALEKGIKLFKTPDSEPFVTFPVGHHFETHQLRSKGFGLWLGRLFYKKFSKPVSAQARKDVIEELTARAVFDGPTLPVSIRVAEFEDGICVDLGDEEWRAVVITQAGWEVVTNPPVKFRRPAGMLALPVPLEGASLETARSLLNIASDADWYLFLGWIVQALKPTGPYPVLVVSGEQGSAKSTAVRLARRLVDPSAAPLRAMPRNERDLMIACQNNWLIALDNLSALPDWLSDALCRVATGGGFTTRRLYTDAEEAIFSAQRPVILNGINTIATRPDLVDRAILLELPRIKEHREEAEIILEFEQILPELLGALFDAISSGLKRMPTLVLKGLPRMADFAKWAIACAPGFDCPEGAFLDAYDQNRNEAVAQTLDQDPVAAALMEFMEDRSSWQGQPSELFNDLGEIVGDRTRKSRAWPGSANWLTRKLKRLSTFLRAAGIEIDRGPKRQVIIRTVVRNSGNSVPESSDQNATTARTGKIHETSK